MSSSSHSLDEVDTTLLKQACKDLHFPIQPPVEVKVVKKLEKENSQTGRNVEYTSLPISTLPRTTCSAFVSLKSSESFGQIESFFIYRSTKFVILHIFNSPAQRLHGLIYIADMTLTARKIVPFDNISLPLVIAINNNHLWILN